MPIYAYRCAECGHAVEVLQKVSDAPLTECPACHRPALAKQVTAAGFQLKGSGWYATDFRDNGKAKPKAKEGAPAEAEKGKDGAEAKPDTVKAPEPAATTQAAAPAPAVPAATGGTAGGPPAP